MEGTTSREKEAAEYGGRGGKGKGGKGREIALAARKSGGESREGEGRGPHLPTFHQMGERRRKGERERRRKTQSARKGEKFARQFVSDESRGGEKNQFQHLISNRGRVAAWTCALKGLLWEDDVVRT